MPRTWITVGLGVSIIAGGVVPAQARTATAARDTCDATTSTPVTQPTDAQMEASGLGSLPIAPDADRVDLVAPPFSDPTNVTNPLFPITELTSAILNGHVDGEPFRTETTLLPHTRIIEWVPGQCVEVVVSQYTAYLGGRIEEVALDYYAQADDGSVWYFGEDVFNYGPGGRIADTDGTWLAGKEGPAAMIMPADPQVGDVNRPENIPGLVFEEVTAKLVDQTMDGPSGPIDGVFVAEELHDDGTFSDKVFAPAYGEFLSAHEGDLEAMALAMPTDALPGGTPAELQTISHLATSIFDRPSSTNADWARASRRADRIGAVWQAFLTGDVPPRLIRPMDRAISALATFIGAHDRVGTRATSVDVSYANVDLQLRYLPVTAIDVDRFELWTRRTSVHAKAGSLTGVRADLATMEWIRDRFVHALDIVDATRIDTHLGALRDSVVDEDLTAAAKIARSLREVVAGLA